MLSTKPSTFARNHLIRDAISQAIYDRMISDSSIHLFGEGCHVKVHYDAPNIERDFSDRVHTLPISEDGNVNFAVGASLVGVKPVVDVITADFLYRAMDSICNTAAKMNFVRPDQLPRTIVIRAEFLTGGPTTGQRPEALFTHIPGLNVVIPSTPRDAYGLMLTALNTPGVTLFFEDRMIKDDVDWQQGDKELTDSLPLGACSLRRMGKRGNVTILTYGVMRQVVEVIISKLHFRGDYYSDDYPMLCDLIDLRCLYPIDWPVISKMLERTGRLLVIEPDVQYGGIGAEIIATVAQQMPEVRVRRLGGPKMTIPASPALYSVIMPSEEQIVEAIRNNW